MMSITYEQYNQMPDDGNRYEIVDGVLELMTPSPSVRHQRILRRISTAFENNCQDNGEFYFAPLDVIFAPDNVRQPDFIFVLKENLHIVTDHGIEGAPDIVGEILSPTTRKKDKTGKFETYRRFGVKEYWIIDPETDIMEQFVLTKNGYLLQKVYQEHETVHSSLLDCISISLADIFK